MTEIKELKRRKDTLARDRDNWETHWQTLADYVLPRKNQIQTKNTPGNRRHNRIYDSTAIRSNVRLASGLHSTLTSPSTKFFDLTTGDQELDRNDEVRAWLQKTADRIWNIIQNSNFQTEIHECYLDLGCFGTGPIFIEQDQTSVVNFAAYPVSDVIIGEGPDGIVNEVHREFKWKARDIVAKWGEDPKAQIPAKVTQAMQSEPEKDFKLCHTVYKEKPSDPQYKSIYWLQAGDEYGSEGSIIKEGKYLSFPWMVPRWSKDSAERYGRSPAMETLPDIRTLNAMMKTWLKAGQKAVDPPLQVPDDGVLRKINLTPGYPNKVRPGSEIRPILTGQRVELGDAMIEKLRSDVQEGFLVDLFSLVNVGDRATAREVDERVQQQLRLLAPILGRMHTELLRPMIARVADIADRRGLLDDPPDELDRPVEAVFSSPLARAQMAQEANVILETFQRIAGLAQVDQTVFDLFDFDGAAKFVAKRTGYPQDIMRTKEEIEQIRQGRANAQQQAIENEEQSRQADTVAKVAPAVAAIEQARGA